MVQKYFSAIKFKKSKIEKTSFRMFNYRLFCGVRPRKFVVAGQIGTTKKHLPEVTGFGYNIMVNIIPMIS
jgi:hypothetical protein